MRRIGSIRSIATVGSICLTDRNVRGMDKGRCISMIRTVRSIRMLCLLHHIRLMRIWHPNATIRMIHILRILRMQYSIPIKRPIRPIPIGPVRFIRTIQSIRNPVDGPFHCPIHLLRRRIMERSISRYHPRPPSLLLRGCAPLIERSVGSPVVLPLDAGSTDVRAKTCSAGAGAGGGRGLGAEG